MRRSQRPKFILAVLLIAVGLSTPSWAQVTTTIKMQNGSVAIEYLPSGFDPSQPYPLLIALHGMGQRARTAYNAWKATAEKHNMILLCVKGSNFNTGYTRSPIDDRKRIVAYKKLMQKKYLIDEDNVVLVGFSRGGNIAIETGLKYPQHFPYVICLFGFFNEGVEKLAAHNDEAAYFDSSFYFITGHGDSTQQSLNRGNRTLKQLGIRSKVFTYKSVHHAYPPNLPRQFGFVWAWFKNRSLGS